MSLAKRFIDKVNNSRVLNEAKEDKTNFIVKNPELLNVIAKEKKDWTTIASSAKLLGLEDKYVKLSPEVQKAIFGAYAFGKQSIMILSDKPEMYVASMTAFGRDANTNSFHLREVAAKIKEGKKYDFSKGWY